jgi:16S rRNA G966 N2-methylase RsmD
MEGIMFTRIILTLAIALVTVQPGFAQHAWQFKWQLGQKLTYKVKHVTAVVESLDKGASSSHSQLDLVNRWTVDEIDAKGVATLSLTLVSMRNEQKRASGETLLFDSQNLEKSTPELREQMVKFIGQTVAVVRVDKYGRLIEVKQGSKNNFEAEPPFLVVFPEAKAAAGQAWRRPFDIVLDPPYGTGEKYEASQRYDCTKIEAGKATVSIKTEFKTTPDNARERLPLLQKDIEGEIVVDLEAGKLISARLNTDQTLENHQGKGSKYQFKSQYWRDLAP